MASSPGSILQVNMGSKEQMCVGLCDDTNLSQEKRVFEMEG